MTRPALRAWHAVHKWTSLICTLFLLMLCVTGLPLIFHDEIEALLDEDHPMPVVADESARVSLDTVLDNALAARPGEVGVFMSFDEDRPVVNVTSAPRHDSPEREMTLMSLDHRTGAHVAAPADDGIMHVILQLHIDMFMGPWGMYLLGVMGLLFAAAIVSGVVLYAPFMRKLDFGTVRAGRSARIRWLDHHNLLGAATLAWALVVGLTGTINAFAPLITGYWQADQLAEMTADYAEAEPPAELASIDAAVRTAMAAAPGMRPQFVAFPGGAFSTDHHYAVFLQGGTPLTKRLLTPALVDARDGALTDMRPMPWYMQALLLSQPLHFGDYGGLPLKILWAVLDLFTIIVLGSGVYLWLARRRKGVDARLLAAHGALEPSR